MAGDATPWLAAFAIVWAVLCLVCGVVVTDVMLRGAPAPREPKRAPRPDVKAALPRR